MTEGKLPDGYLILKYVKVEKKLFNIKTGDTINQIHPRLICEC